MGDKISLVLLVHTDTDIGTGADSDIGIVRSLHFRSCILLVVHWFGFALVLGLPLLQVFLLQIVLVVFLLVLVLAALLRKLLWLDLLGYSLGLYLVA